ncbi:hypothetical protein SAMN05421595_2327 [Austwickia chelonae]|uniref:Uncharacterized protein n=1 Tax=Austwickia chelonae NBRC 105200 TaxID=1184607 RepID=K6V8X4_9MICO|nr:hypothetical protein [Austwickia chelonae]GAB78673.1 hypothetical protein AUCHE_16_00920 [Austwickia chelonae NBRC 105200]SEW34597.1 hypothetical protein SAMN05421595_2327 [Austwickia chelonae]
MDANASATLSRSTHRRRTAATTCRQNTTQNQQLAVNALESMPASTCPTCLAATTPALDALPGSTHPGVTAQTCPTCGDASIEYGLMTAIDTIVNQLNGLDRLEQAL